MMVSSSSHCIITLFTVLCKQRVMWVHNRGSPLLTLAIARIKSSCLQIHHYGRKYTHAYAFVVHDKVRPCIVSSTGSMKTITYLCKRKWQRLIRKLLALITESVSIWVASFSNVLGLLQVYLDCLSFRNWFVNSLHKWWAKSSSDSKFYSDWSFTGSVTFSQKIYIYAVTERSWVRLGRVHPHPNSKMRLRIPNVKQIFLLGISLWNLNYP